MRRILFLVFIFIATMLSAEVLNVKSVERLNIPQNADSKIAGISPDGTYVLITSQTNEGLKKFDLLTGKVTTITDAMGAGYRVEISADSKEVTYREVTYGKDKSRLTSLVRQDLITAKKSTLVKSTRDVHRARVRRAIAPMVAIENGELVLTVGTVTKVLSPNGQGLSYLWASISPDGSKIVYYVSGSVWVCNIDGTNPQCIGKFRAPQWYNNNIIVGMNDHDNGYYVTSSEIVAYTLDGAKQVLTNNTMMAMYPYVSADGSRIVCSTPTGEAYLINIK